MDSGPLLSLTFDMMPGDRAPPLSRLQVLLRRLPEGFGLRPLRLEPADPELLALLEIHRLPEHPKPAARNLIAARGAIWARGLARQIVQILDGPIPPAGRRGGDHG